MCGWTWALVPICILPFSGLWTHLWCCLVWFGVASLACISDCSAVLWAESHWRYSPKLHIVLLFVNSPGPYQLVSVAQKTHWRCSQVACAVSYKCLTLVSQTLCYLLEILPKFDLWGDKGKLQLESMLDFCDTGWSTMLQSYIHGSAQTYPCEDQSRSGKELTIWKSTAISSCWYDNGSAKLCSRYTIQNKTMFICRR